MRLASVLVLIVTFASLARADEASLSVLAASVGTWEGELYYLDYQSGQRFGIPMRVEADITPDGATLIRRLTFTDPGNLVYAVNITTVDRGYGQLVEAYFREQSAEFLQAKIVAVEYDDDSRWRLVYELDGTDDDRPARIRHTIERSGNQMTSSKEVRFLDQESEFFLRNGTELRLVSGPGTPQPSASD